MAPKTIRNPGDKNEGTKMIRIGRDKGEPARNSKSSVKPRQDTDIMLEIKVGESREKEFGPPKGNIHPQMQQVDQSEHSEPRSREGTVTLTGLIMEKVDQQEAHGSPKRWGKTTGKDSQLMDWGKDSSDTFYSLTEESDPSSSDYNLSESEDSEISATVNISSSNEPTLRQPRRQRKSVKIRPCYQEGSENSMSMGGKTLKWDYSGIGLADTPTLSHQGSTNGKMEKETGARPNTSSMMGTEAGLLQSIYSSIKELQTETRIESRRARIATKRLQGLVRKVVKSCTEIKVRLDGRKNHRS
ncbi:hypothetical protein NDU88_005902 [Pleurodeles waltl]|uniref:Uncharacterized protein n=1 Tax=Pleurodeles waltl TaxID=8319 RepID=A0AAV7LQV2_PLEWA|nr:hypothetical protein NDU88_005902 [Pleurodeles waltl]